MVAGIGLMLSAGTLWYLSRDSGVEVRTVEQSDGFLDKTEGILVEIPGKEGSNTERLMIQAEGV